MGEREQPFKYVGSELALFSKAKNWKGYFAERIVPYLGDRVLEVGAGLGGTTKILCTGQHNRWVCLEPDSAFVEELEQQIQLGALPGCCEAMEGILPSPQLLPKSFDAILYIDVLEHIEQDGEELKKAVEYLAPGGNLIVLSPAHNWLFSPFDEALGHFRRYSRKTLAALNPPDVELKRLEYLDSVGLMASLANRMLLKQRMPTEEQIGFWDRSMVTVSRRLDPLLGFAVGKSIIAIWQRR